MTADMGLWNCTSGVLEPPKYLIDGLYSKPLFWVLWRVRRMALLVPCLQVQSNYQSDMLLLAV